MTFLERLHAHKGELIRLNAAAPWSLTQGPSAHLSGKIGIIQSVHYQRILHSHPHDRRRDRLGGGVDVSLFINGNIDILVLFEEDVQFLKGSQ